MAGEKVNSIRKRWTKIFKEELDKLDKDDKEVLEATICFDETSEKIRRLF